MTTPINTVPLSPSVEVGDILFTSGQLALVDGAVVGTTIEEQTGRVIDAIENILQKTGLTLDNVMKTIVWLTRTEDFAGFNETYRARFAGPFPARSTVICGLALPGALVEIEAIASRTATRA